MNAATKEFWGWFKAHEADIRKKYDGEDWHWLDQNIKPRIGRISTQLNWEIGPYKDPDYTFVLSPVSRAELKITRAAIAQAPNISGWHFLHAKPPKELKALVFEFGGHSVNADRWCYRLTSYNQGEFVDIDLLINEAERVSRDTVDTFAELVVEAIIGEEMRLERVGYLTVNSVGDNTGEGTTSIVHLRDHLMEVLAK